MDSDRDSAMPRMQKRSRPELARAVFLDRDGTINHERNYVHRFDDWEWIEGAIPAIGLLNSLGFTVIVVTNQSGIARGYYSEDDVKRLHGLVDRMLALAGARIDAYLWCPHHPSFGAPCECRKPKPGMLLKAAEKMSIDLRRSFLVGDKKSDIDAAISAEVTPILVATGYGETAHREVPAEVVYVPSILEAAGHIEKSSNQRG